MLKTLAVGFAAVAAGEVYFEEDFSGDWASRWTLGKAAGKEMGKFEVSAGKWFVDEDKDKGLQATEDMRHYSISAKMPKVASSKGKELVIQFSAKIENHQYAYCGGGYIKLMPDSLKQETFGGDDEYHVMFGPDLCGYDISHVHAIFNNKGENLLKTDKVNLEYSDKNEFTHLYTMHIKPDGEYEIFFDLESKAKGKIVEDWGFPKPMIDDPSDSKPSDWVDEEEIDDPAAKKPDGYDDIPAQIPDPDATKPEDWDDEDDGEWEPPLIDNPEFKGEWVAPKITNPAYKGEWKPKQIKNVTRRRRPLPLLLLLLRGRRIGCRRGRGRELFAMPLLRGSRLWPRRLVPPALLTAAWPNPARYLRRTSTRRVCSWRRTMHPTWASSCGLSTMAPSSTTSL